jgi:hypothetical protein
MRKTIKTNKQVPAEILCWVFFGSQGITDSVDLMRCHNFCMTVERLKLSDEKVTVESLKKSGNYLGMINDIPSYLISDGEIQKIIDFKI